MSVKRGLRLDFFIFAWGGEILEFFYCDGKNPCFKGLFTTIVKVLDMKFWLY